MIEVTMYHEMLRLLQAGERVVVTGMKGSGKSYTISKLSSEFNSFRSVWYCSEWATKKAYSSYSLFDRCNWIDRYVYHNTGDETLDICIHFYKEYLSGSYLCLMMSEKWKHLRKSEFTEEDEDRFRRRFVKIGIALYNAGAIKGLIISTSEGWSSTDFTPLDVMYERIKEEYKW